MSDQWRGLHNPDRHSGEFLDPDVADCSCCECRYCAKDSPCRCCLTIEVEAQTARADAAEAALRRVREACEQQTCYGEYGPDAEVVAALPVHVIVEALDGAE